MDRYLSGSNEYIVGPLSGSNESGKSRRGRKCGRENHWILQLSALLKSDTKTPRIQNITGTSIVVHPSMVNVIPNEIFLSRQKKLLCCVTLTVVYLAVKLAGCTEYMGNSH